MKDIEFKYKEALVGLEKIKNIAGTLSEYIDHLSHVSGGGEGASVDYGEIESSINLPFDVETYKIVKEKVYRIRTESLKYIIVVGIGGSNLGTKAIYEALRTALDIPSSVDKCVPEVIFADTTDPELLFDICRMLKEEIRSLDDVVVNIISKSGFTTETIANFEVVYSTLKERFGDEKAIADRIIVTTDNDSKLWDVAHERGFELLSIPKNVGGRYSVFSSVGLFPLMLAGVDTARLLNGARVMRDKCISKKELENPALVSATITYLHNRKNISINNTFFFNPNLESVGKWYSQLIGESLGKKYSINGEEVNAGITPITSVGSTDLHSTAQLYLGGPKDKFTTFVYAPNSDKDISVPRSLILSGLVEGIGGKKVSCIMSAIFDGVKEAYKKNELPFAEVKMSGIDEYTLGQFMQFKMMEVMYMAQFLDVNAFDQPNVEDYKTETREILEKKK